MKELDILKEDKSVESIILFGSKLKGKKSSDTDICIIPTNKLSLKNKLKIISKLSENFDVSFYENLPVHLRKEALSKGKVLFTKNYYRILELMKINDLEYIKYKAFLDDYHEKAMGKT